LFFTRVLKSVFFYHKIFYISSLFSLPSSRRTGGFFLMHQKETKKMLIVG